MVDMGVDPTGTVMQMLGFKFTEFIPIPDRKPTIDEKLDQLITNINSIYDTMIELGNALKEKEQDYLYENISFADITIIDRHGNIISTPRCVKCNAHMKLLIGTKSLSHVCLECHPEECKNDVKS